MTRSAMVLILLGFALTMGCDPDSESGHHIRAFTDATSDGDVEATDVLSDNGVIQSPACHQSECAKKNKQYPDPEWEHGLPEDHGLSTEGLEAMAELADQLDSKCLVVIHDGVMVGEWYWDGYDANTDVPDVFSITKSVTSAIFGVAESRGLLDIDDRVSDYVPEWANTDSEDVTIRQLLVHDSGRTFDLGLEWGLPAVPDQTTYSLGAGQSAPPESQWEYTNLGYQSLEAVLDEVLCESVEEFAQEELFEPIGMTVKMGQDPSGNTTLYSGLSASCRDLARFGYLYQQKGKWKQDHVLKSKYVRNSLETSTDFNDAYGVGWWLNNQGHVMLPQVQNPFEYDGRFIPSADEDVYTALGAFGNFITVDPEDGYIVVRLTDVWDLQDVLSLGDIDAIWAAFEDAKE